MGTPQNVSLPPPHAVDDLKAPVKISSSAGGLYSLALFQSHKQACRL